MRAAKLSELTLRSLNCLSITACMLLFLFALEPIGSEAATPIYKFEIVNTYPHDPDAYTQGLVLDGKFLYEGTGLHGKSTLRKVDLSTGKVLKKINLPPAYFGEGITVVENQIIQLTWQSRKGFVYDKRTFRITREFDYKTEGWGITFDGRHLIMSDGTAFLQFLDPKTYQRIRAAAVSDEGRLIANLNELEYVNGEILANIWGRDVIARISPHSGMVTGWIDLTGLRRHLGKNHNAEVLNGIAYDPKRKTLLVTGKNWPKLFEIQLSKPK